MTDKETLKFKVVSLPQVPLRSEGRLRRRPRWQKVAFSLFAIMNAIALYGHVRSLIDWLLAP